MIYSEKIDLDNNATYAEIENKRYSMTQNYMLLLQYDGSKYRGWQVQGNTDQTIQGKLEAVLSKLAGEPVEVQGSGRTDAGVHAYGQVANFKLKEPKPENEIMAYLNQYLPEDIAVLAVEKANERFHSRLNAVEKTYRYRIFTDGKPDVFDRKYVAAVTEPLHINQMKIAAGYLTGKHDFTSLCGNKNFKKSAVRTIYDIRFEEKERELAIWVCGDGFLQNMVRILIGTLVEVGIGKRKAEDMPAILDAKNRTEAGMMMPATGLALMEVKYK